MEEIINIERFLDAEGKITQLPRKHSPRLAVLKYLSEKFDFDCIYTEKQINQLCESWHTFGDFFMLRRELVDYGFLNREKDGSKYWRVKQEDE